MKHIRFALAQLNSHIGNLNKNLDLAVQACIDASKNNANIIIFPELFLTGYIPQDLLLEPYFLQRCKQQLDVFIQKSKSLNLTIIIGSVHKQFSYLYNAAYVIKQGECIDVYHKRHLPNTEVFDEQRYFFAGKQANYINLYGVNIELAICEDIWHEKIYYTNNTSIADIVIAINASPYTIDKYEQRIKYFKQYTKNQQHAIYVNMVGGNDEIVFDGASFCLDAYGGHQQLLAKFEESIAYIDYKLTEANVDMDINVNVNVNVNVNATRWSMPNIINTTSPKNIILYSIHQNLNEMYQAVLIATRDYVQKNGFKQVVIGLSGGIDSALVACIATSALGHENVHTIMMPSKYTHTISLEDAQLLAQNLNISYEIISIQAIVDIFKQELNHSTMFNSLNENINANDFTYENLQARIRGNILMAYANRKNALVLTTGNKSELAVGYCTLYGDMCGAFAPIKDLLKTQVYDICYYLNEKHKYNNEHDIHLIPQRILTRAPSAELRPDQTDQDSLPPYDILDAILLAHIEFKKDAESIHAQTNIDLSIIKKILRLIKLSEYKRQQSVLGPKISARSFGKDWRYDIAAFIDK